VVITAQNEPGYRKLSLEGIEIHYAPVPYDNRYGFTQRTLSFFQFVLKSVKFAARHRDADLCYTISTPLTTGIAAILIKRWFKIPYIFEVGDLWPEAPIQMGFIRSAFLKRFLFRMEKAIYKNASEIVALSLPIQETIEKKIPGKTVHLLPNMADTAFYKPEVKSPALEKKFGVEGKFVVSYIGAIGLANGLHYFLDCAAACQRQNQSIHFLLCGEGAMLEDLKQHAQKVSLDNLTFILFQNREGIAEIMNVTDANFICYRPVNILETGSPNKYFDGLAAGKLTVINFGGWIREEVERERCGIYVDPKEPADFSKKIKPFLNDPIQLKLYQQAGRALAERKYSRRMLGENFYSLMAGAVEKVKEYS